jgi:putative N6-adenine-specific DNA methylase
MVDFAQRNAERAGVANAVQFRGGDALERMPPVAAGVMLVNPPYGERIDVAGAAGITAKSGAEKRAQFQGQTIDEFGLPVTTQNASAPTRDRSANPGREQAQTDSGEEASDFFPKLATHWKKNYAGWTAHVLTPDLKLPSKMRLKESRRVPMWNGPIECRLFRFDMVAGSARDRKTP